MVRAKEKTMKEKGGKAKRQQTDAALTANFPRHPLHTEGHFPSAKKSKIDGKRTDLDRKKHFPPLFCSIGCAEAEEVAQRRVSTSPGTYAKIPAAPHETRGLAGIFGIYTLQAAVQDIGQMVSCCWRAACAFSYSSLSATTMRANSRRPVPAGMRWPQMTFSFMPSK